ncbi:MAG: ATP-binding protein [Deltaproteobacteria bacterium]|nr:ATP-binding protein [Deltaproteobacteria bacterium]
MTYIHRQIESKVKSLLATFPSLAVTGPRQSGKSTLLIQTLKEYKYVSFDDPLFRDQSLSDPHFFLDSIGAKVIIDEIQLSPQILSYVKMRIDRERTKKGLYVFTGSQQFSMIKNLGDSLAGRIALLDLLPLSVHEKKVALPIKNTLDYLVDACLRGSYPEVVTDAALESGAWYGSYVQTYLERDVRNIYNIGNLRDFQRFLRLLATRCGQILNLSAFAGDIGLSVPTIRNWLSILEASRMVYLLPPYYNNLGKRITKAPKVYFLDCGLVCYLVGLRDREHLLKGPMAGALFENFYIQETVKFFLNRGERPPLYYLRTNNNLEIDLLIEGPVQTLLPAEFKLTKTPNLSMGSNISRVKKAFSALPFTRGVILCLADQAIPLSPEISVLTFDHFIKTLETFIKT